MGKKTDEKKEREIKMFIKKLKVENFRCLKNVEIDFEEDITLIVGENDTGKSSLLDVLRLLFIGEEDSKNKEERLKIEREDFYVRGYEFNEREERQSQYQSLDDNREKSIKINVFLSNGDELECIKNIDQPLQACFMKSTKELKKYIENPESINELSQEEMKKLINLLGGNSSRIRKFQDKLIELLIERKNEISNKDKIKLEQVNPSEILGDFFDIVYLDGKTFYNVEDLLFELYLKEDLKTILENTVSIGNSEKKISEIIDVEISTLLMKKEEEINELLLPEIKRFLPEISRISLTHKLGKLEINRKVFNLEVQIQDKNNSKIMLNKKGDGSKRRITFALLRHVEKNDEGKKKLYLFDEPDTHLHVKAQYELMSIIETLKQNNQVVLTTHSPFIINYISPKKIIVFERNNTQTSAFKLSSQCDLETLLKELGIENSNLFFTRKILLVEGESDKEALKLLYNKVYNRYMINDLITVIAIEGCTKVDAFSKLLIEIMPTVPLYAFLDRDILNNPYHNISRFIEECERKNINFNIIGVGTKELEDAFNDEVLRKAVCSLIRKRKEIDYSVEKEVESKIQSMRETLKKDNNFKYSKEIQKFIKEKADIDIGKTEILVEIANVCDVSDIPQEVNELFCKLREEG